MSDSNPGLSTIEGMKQPIRYSPTEKSRLKSKEDPIKEMKEARHLETSSSTEGNSSLKRSGSFKGPNQVTERNLENLKELRKKNVVDCLFP